jgi:uncharacterized protein YkwD
MLRSRARRSSTQFARRLPTAALIVTSLAILAPATAAAATGADARAEAMNNGCAYADALAGQTSTDNFKASTLCLMNAQRAGYGLRPLRAQSRLAQAAASFANEMVARQFFAHESPSGSTPLSRIKATRYLRKTITWMVGENIAWGTGRMATPRATVKAWMQSPPHRKNLLDPMYNEVGIGIANGAPQALDAGEQGSTYVTDFGRRRLR